jgi:hypothetical protein
MSIHATKLKLKATGEEVDAELHDELPIDALFDAEEVWAPERVRFLRDFMRAGAPADLLPQSIHWSWSLKAAKMPGLNLGPLSAYRLFGIRAENAWQGLLLGCCVGNVTRIDPKGRDLVYVDFVESAPWNWELKQAGRAARLKGVGLQLMELAVQWSIDSAFKGRVGCHALPQADTFYRDVCKMTDLGEDANYKALRYFEFTEQQAIAFMG